jgi:uncharacterized protein YggT (Ycf19 family)
MPPTADRYNEAKVRRRRLILVIGKVVVLLVYLVLVAYAVILGIAFFLRLFGANPTADFAEWIYRSAARIMEPFRGIFPTTQLSDTSFFDASLLFAIVIYLVAAIILHGIVDWFSRRISHIDVERDRRRYWSSLAVAQAPQPAPVPQPAQAAATAPVATAPAATTPVVPTEPAQADPIQTPLPTRTPPASVPDASGEAVTSRGEGSGSIPPSGGLPNGPTSPSGAERASTSGVGRVNPPKSP